MVAFGSVRSCGVTTLALSVAATWPAERRVLLVEADPAGGTLAAGVRVGGGAESGVARCRGAAGRRSESGVGPLPASPWRGGGVGRSTVGRAAPVPRSTMLDPLLGRLGELDADVLVDCGRLDLGSPSRPVVGAGRPGGAGGPTSPGRPAGVGDLARSPPLNGGRLGLVTMGDGPFADTEIAEALGVEVLARLPWDPRRGRGAGVGAGLGAAAAPGAAGPGRPDVC